MRGLQPYLLSGHENPQHPRWNDLKIQPHPGGAEPPDWILLTDQPVATAAQAWEIHLSPTKSSRKCV